MSLCSTNKLAAVLLALGLISISLVKGQIRANGCYSATGCQGSSIRLTTITQDDQISECCLGNQGESYSIFGICQNCLVYGFLESIVDGREGSQPHIVQIGYMKGTGPAIQGRLELIPGGTAVLGSDFTMSAIVVTMQPGVLTDVIVNFLSDRIAQENVETVQLRFAPRNGTLQTGGIFRSTITIRIRDSDNVVFQLSNNAYQADEDQLSIAVTVRKNGRMRLANPVTFLITPYNISEAERTNQSLPANIPPDNNHFSPNRAKSNPPERRDFSTDSVRVVFPADEVGLLVRDISAAVGIMDDELNEAVEYFMIVLTVENSVNPGNVLINRPSSLCGIFDNDEIRIGFQKSSYTFYEPEFETEIFNTVFLEKEDGRVSEQTFGLGIEFVTNTPSSDIQPALLSSVNTNNDYVINDPDQRFFLLIFGPNSQVLDTLFTLFPDAIAEGAESFYITSSFTEESSAPDFANPVNLFASTFIIILDNDVLCTDLPTHSQATISYTFGTVNARPHISAATYSCASGYTLVGNEDRVCQRNRTWSGVQPTCSAVSCGFPPSISNGSPGTPIRTTFGGIVTYSCDNGYALSGSATVTCQTSGNWSTIPFCKVRSRQFKVFRGEEEKNLQFSQDRNLLYDAAFTGETAEISISESSQTVIVQDLVLVVMNCLPWLRKFSGGTVRWRRGTEFFGPGVELDPGDRHHVWGGKFNETLSFVLNRRVYFGRRRCTSYRGDDGIYMCQVCTDHGSPSEECNTANVTVHRIGGQPFIDKALNNDSAVVETDEEVHYKVGANFCIQRGSRKRYHLLCSPYEMPVEISRASPEPSRAWLFNGDLIYQTLQYGPLPSIRTDTDPEFFMDPPERILLFPDTVSPSALTPLQSGGISINLLAVNVTVNLIPPGVTIENVHDVLFDTILGEWTCLVNNTLGTDSATSVIRECLANCTDLPPLTNGVITYSTTSTPRLEGTTATHSCNIGYRLSNGTVRICQSDGVWSGERLTCEAVSCGSPPSISNGSPGAPTRTTFGGTVTYSCDSGYVLSGSATVVCQAGGIWNTPSVCTAIGCPVGTYEENLSTGENACLPCPANSISTVAGSKECTCFDGYYRAALETPNIPCSSPPSSCRNLQVVEERTRATTITVRWKRPEITGREDFYYNIFYSEDNKTFIQHNSRPYMKQDALVDYSLSGLKSLTTYTIRVAAENGVSGQEGGYTSRHRETSGITGETRANAPPRVLGLCTNVVWTAPTRSYGMITGYDVRFVRSDDNGSMEEMTVTKGSRELFHVIGNDVPQANDMLVQVRAKTLSADGMWSKLVPLGCSESMKTTCPPCTTNPFPLGGS